MDQLANTEVGSAADVASHVAESVSSGDQRLLDDDDGDYEMSHTNPSMTELYEQFRREKRAKRG